MIQVPASSFNSAADVARDAVATSIGVARFFVAGRARAWSVALELQIGNVALELQIGNVAIELHIADVADVATELHIADVATDGIVCYMCI